MKTSPGLRLLIVLLLTPFFIALIHALLSRAMRPLRPAVSNHAVVLSAIAAGHIPVLLAVWFLALRTVGDTNGFATAIVYSIVVYEALAYSYFHLFNMSETARRIRILYNIKRSPLIKAGELSAAYGSEDMLTNRLERLVALRQVRLSKGRYFLNSRLLHFGAQVVSAWALVLGLPSPISVYKKNIRRL